MCETMFVTESATRRYFECQSSKLHALERCDVAFMPGVADNIAGAQVPTTHSVSDFVARIS